MKRINKKIRLIIVAISVILISCVTVTVFAAPSIGDLHESEAPVVNPESTTGGTNTVQGEINGMREPSGETTIGNSNRTTIRAVSTDGTNTAEILSGYDIYTNRSISTQYMRVDENGNLVPTPLSNLIDISADTVSKVGENGNSVTEKIPSVKEIIESYCKNANMDMPGDAGVELDKLDQLTYWLDFKYVTTDYKVTAGESVEKDNQTVELDDGMIEAEIKGGEIFRDCDMSDHILIQIDAKTGEIHFLKMKEYDAETGNYVVQFPCIGPYIVTQIM